MIFFIGIGLTVLLLVTGLPLRFVSPEGQLATIALYVLNPPMMLVVLVASHGAHELESSIWPQLQYPITVVVSVLWWGLVRYSLKHILRKRDPGQE